MEDPEERTRLASGPSAPGSEHGARSGEDAPDVRGTDPLRYSPEERYVEREEVGRGASGRVVLTYDRRIARTVARKELAPARGATLGDVHRFTREVTITGQLEHPAIVPVYDAGVTPGGEHYYTMPYLAGESLRHALAARPQLARRLELLGRFARVCEAMALAHSRGVIHRDLKPANIMLGSFGKAFVVDWGLAKVSGSPDSSGDAVVQSFGAADETSHGDVLGTPSYMSPEQARGENADERSDVWGLGACLYHILAGEPPVRAAGGSVDRLIERVRRAEIVPIDERVPEAAPELRAIVARAMRPRPEQRFAHAGELAEDLRAYLEGGRVGSYEYSTTELLLRFGRRHRWALLGTALSLAVITGMGVDSYRRTSAERDRAQAAEQVARAERDRARTAQEAANRLLVETLAEKARALASTRARAEAEVLAADALVRGSSPEALGVLARFAATPRVRLETTTPLPAGCGRPRLDASAGRLLCLGEGTVGLWSIGSPTPVWSQELEAYDGSFVGDGATVAVRIEGAVRVLSALDGHQVGADHPKRLRIEVLPGGRFATLDEGDVQIHDAQGEVEHVLRPCVETSPSHFAATADLARVATVCAGGEVFLGPVEDPRSLQLEVDRAPMSLAFEPRGTRLALGGVRGAVRLFDGDTGRPLRVLLETAPLISALAWSPDGGSVAAIHEDCSISLFETDRDGVVGRLPGRTSRLPAVVFAGDAGLTTVTDGVRRWHLPSPWPPDHVRSEHGLSHAVISPDGVRLATIHGDGAARIWRLDSGALEATLDWQERVGKRLAWSPDGRWLAAVTSSPTGVALWPTGHWDARETLGEANHPRMGFVAGGAAILAVPYNNTEGLELWTLADRSLTLVPGMDHAGVDLYVTPGAGTALAVDSQGTLYRVAPDDAGKWAARPVARAGSVYAIAMASDGASVVTVDRAKPIEVRNLPSGEIRGTVERPGQLVLDVALSPDDRYLVATDQDRTTHVFDYGTLERVATLRGHDERVVTAEFDGTGHRMVTASWDGTARLWSLEPLGRSPAELQAEMTRAWAMELEMAIAAPLR